MVVLQLTVVLLSHFLDRKKIFGQPKNLKFEKCGTIMFLNFRTDRSEQTVQTQIRLLWVYTVSLFATPSAIFGHIALQQIHIIQF